MTLSRTTPAIDGARSNRGFTLLELLVAVAIFAVVATLAWGGLDAIVRAHRVLDHEATTLARLQKGLGRFERDVSAALPRPIRNEHDQIEPALAGGVERIDVSIWLKAAPGPAAAMTLQRVSWACVEGKLQRTYWSAPDRTSATEHGEQVLLDHVTRCRLRYLARDGTATERWPPLEMPANTLPRGVEISFHLEGHGAFRRVIELVQAAEVAR